MTQSWCRYISYNNSGTFPTSQISYAETDCPHATAHGVMGKPEVRATAYVSIIDSH